MKKIQEIIINLQKNAITRKNMILEKIRKKNHQIWNLYEGEIPVTNFNPELKKKYQSWLCSSHRPRGTRIKYF